MSADAKDGIIKKAADGRIKPAVLSVGGVTKTLQGISPGTLAVARAALGGDRDEEADAASGADIAQLRVTQGTLGCRARNTDGNVRVNQDCTFRRQAEELIKINPTDPQNMIAGQNDSRIGFNHCGFDYTFDGGTHWGDGIPPFFQRLNSPPPPHTIAGGPGTDHTYDAASDPALAFDSQGRAFYSCVLFDVNTNASGVFVTQSPQGAGGSFYDNVPAAGSRFVVVEDNNVAAFHDKEFIAADSFASSPNRDNVYVTWTVFKFGAGCLGGTDVAPTFCSSPIFGSMSTDHAVTWSRPEVISGASPLCQLGNFFDPTASANACNLDQGSDPQPQPDGSLAVIFNNNNTTVATPAGPQPSPNAQQLGVLCHPSGSSTAGTAHLNCAPPSKVGDDIAVGEPQCDFGRGPEECVPGPFIRTNDFPRIAIDKASGALYAVWQDYRNGEYDIQISRSTDHGVTWTEGGTLNPDRGKDHYEPAVDVGTNHAVAASYYKSDRVPNENVTPVGGFAPGVNPGVRDPANKSSYWLAGREQPNTGAPATPFGSVRVSPFFPPPDGAQAGFNGDYSGLAVIGKTAHPVWSDTRNSAISTAPSQGVIHDEDVFTDARAIPNAEERDNDDGD